MKKVWFLLASLLVVNTAFTQPWAPPANKLYRANARDISAGARSSSGDTLYLANADTIRKSTNSGASWFLPGNALSDNITAPTAVAANPKNPNRVVAGKSGSLQRSVNGGSTWSQVQGISALTPLCLHVSKSDTNLMFAGYYSENGFYSLYRSTDGGASWSTVSGFSGTIYTDVRQVATISTSPRYVYLAGNDPEHWNPPTTGTTRWGIYFSSDTGKSFSRILTGSSDKMFSVGVYDSSGVRHVFGGERHGTNLLKHTSDDGSNWHNVSLSANVDTIFNIQTYGSIVYLATDDGVYIKSGSAWNSGFTKYASGMFWPPSKSITISPINTDSIYSASEYSVFRGVDLTTGGTWTAAEAGINLVKTVSSSSDNGLSLADSRSIPAIGRMANGSWTKYALQDGGTEQVFLAEHILLDPYTTSRAFAAGFVGGDGWLFYSTDTGKIWSKSNSKTSANGFFGTAVDPAGHDRIHLWGDGVSSLNGNWWINASGGSSGSWGTAKAIDGGTRIIYSMALDSTNATTVSKIMYAGLQSTSGSSGGVFRTADADAGTPTWTLWSPTAPTAARRTVFAVALNPLFASVVFAGGEPKGSPDNQGMWRSTNSGTNWSSLSGRTDTVKRILIDPRFTNKSDSSKYLYVLARASGGSDKIYRSSDRGDNWTDVTGSLPTPIYDLRNDRTVSTTISVATEAGVYVGNLTAKPTLTSPTSGATNLLTCPSPVLQWNSVTNADSYKVEIATSISFSSPAVSVWKTTTSYIFGSASCGQKYYWRIAATNLLGNSPWAVDSFTVGATPPAPSLTTPIADATNVIYCSPVTFQWATECAASTYRIQIDSTSDFANGVLKDTTTANLTYILASGALGCGRTYHWRVASHNCNGDGSWSAARTLTTQGCSEPGSSPAHSLPTSNAVNECVNSRFQWGSVANTSDYTLEVSVNRTMSPVLRTTTTASTQYDYASPYLATSTKYYWHVRANNCDGPGSYSNTDSFTTRSNSEPCVSKMAIGPEEITIKPKEFLLAQNHPNPFNPKTEIKYELPQDVHVSVIVYDILGRQVAELVNEYQLAGAKVVSFEASSMPSGIYFYRIHAGKFVNTKKMLLVR